MMSDDDDDDDDDDDGDDDDDDDDDDGDDGADDCDNVDGVEEAEDRWERVCGIITWDLLGESCCPNACTIRSMIVIMAWRAWGVSPTRIQSSQYRTSVMVSTVLSPGA